MEEEEDEEEEGYGCVEGRNVTLTTINPATVSQKCPT
jgi:hypothetical protein